MAEIADKKTVVLTGVKPTGQPHIGNYLGAIRPAIELSRQPGSDLGSLWPTIMRSPLALSRESFAK